MSGTFRGRGSRHIYHGPANESDDAFSPNLQTSTNPHSGAPKVARGRGKRNIVRQEDHSGDPNLIGIGAATQSSEQQETSPIADGPSSSKRLDEGKRKTGKARNSCKRSDHSAGINDDLNRMDVEDTRPEEEKILDHLFHSIFYNDLIFQKIAAYLNHGDLQVLSGVSKGFYGLTHSYRPFIDKTTLNLNFVGHKNNDYGSIPWTSIKCELKKLMTKRATRQQKFSNVTKILKNAEHLYLYHDPHLPYTCSKYLAPFLSSSPELKSLTLNYTMLQQDIHKILKEEVVVDTLRKIESLAFTRCGSSNFTNSSSNNFLKNILSLVDIPFTLQKLIYTNSNDFSELVHLSSIADFVEKQKESLRELILEGGIFKSDKLKTVVCPRLKKLEVTINQYSEETFTIFLRNQPVIVDLNIRHRQGIRKNLLDAIEAKSVNLKKLCLRVPYFVLDVVPLVHPVDPPRDEDLQDEDWEAAMPDEPSYIPLNIDFFGSMVNLVEFSMSQRRSYAHNEDKHIVTVEEALNSLPNEQIRVLKLAGMKLGTWLGTYDENTLTAVAAFSRLPATLTELHLLDCDAAINDRTFQFLIANFTLLRVFRVSGGDLTGYAFTGVSNAGNIPTGREEPPGVSIKRLKGLQDLAIVNLGPIPGDALVTSIEFLELMLLDMRPQNVAINVRPRPSLYNMPTYLTNDQIVQIVKQNPSLKSLCVTTTDEEDLRNRIQELPTRIKENQLKFKDSSYMTLGASDDSSSEEEDYSYEESISGGSFDNMSYYDDYDDFVGGSDSDDMGYDLDDLCHRYNDI